MKNLHLINNEKITMDMIKLFDEVVKEGDINVYVIFDRKTNYGNDYSEYKNVFLLDDLGELLHQYVYDNIIIHSLDIKKVIFFETHIKYKAKVIWLLWGGEIYNRPEYGYNKLYGSETLRLLLLSDPLKEIPKFVVNRFRGNVGKMGKIKSFAKKVDIIGTTLYDDYLTAKQIFNIDPEFKEFNFYTLDNHVGDNAEVDPDISSIVPMRIILGNSGDPSNNHCETLKWLAELGDIDTNIICPLAYGPTRYRGKVLEYGKAKFDERFKPVTTFMQYNEYVSLLNSVKIGVFGFRRQQGFGNIVNLLYLGKTVILDRRNPMFNFLHSKGIHIREMSSLIPYGRMTNCLISDREIAENRNKIAQLFSKERCINLANHLFK